MAIRVIVAAEHEMFRECLVRRLSEEPDLQVVADAGDASEAARQAGKLLPDVVVLEVEMPGGPFVAGREMLRRRRSPKLVCLADHCSDALVAEGLRTGAQGYVLKGCSAAELVRAIREVAAGRRYYAKEVAARLLPEGDGVGAVPARRMRAARLSPRELEVLCLLAEGHSVKQAAALLKVSYKTVDNQATSLMKKLDIHSRAELVRYAVRERLVVV
jgi:DNA-binding NarL/FixJ family response regulator